MDVTRTADLPGGTTPGQLAAALRDGLHRPGLVVDSARCAPVVHTITAPVTAFLSRISVRAHDDEGPLEISLIAKGLQSALHGLPPQIPAEDRERIAAGIPWRLEWEIYTAGTAALMPGGVRLPQLFAAVEHADDRLTLWLEDVDPLEDPWSAGDLARAGAALGRLTVRRAGQHLATLPPGSFLAHLVENGLRHWAIPQLLRDELWAHPAFAQEDVAALRRDLTGLIARVDDLFQALSVVPWHNTHGDPTPMNLLRPRSDPHTFVLIDWGTAARGPVGWDAVPLVFGPAENGTLAPTDLTDRLAVVVPAYEAGLADEGLVLPAGAVATAVRAAALLRYPLTSLPLSEAVRGVAVTEELLAHARRKAAFVRSVLDVCG